MAFNDLQREALVKVLSFSIPDQTNLDADAQTPVAYFVVPFNCELKGFQAGYVTEAGTGPACTFRLRHDTTVLLTAAATAAATPVRSEASDNVLLTKGEILNVTIQSANDDNDFTGLNAHVEVQAPVSSDA